jgi:hypothetical protein
MCKYVSISLSRCKAGLLAATHYFRPCPEIIKIVTEVTALLLTSNIKISDKVYNVAGREPVPILENHVSVIDLQCI